MGRVEAARKRHREAHGPHEDFVEAHTSYSFRYLWSAKKAVLTSSLRLTWQESTALMRASQKLDFKSDVGSGNGTAPQFYTFNSSDGQSLNLEVFPRDLLEECDVKFLDPLTMTLIGSTWQMDFVETRTKLLSRFHNWTGPLPSEEAVGYAVEAYEAIEFYEASQPLDDELSWW